ncbi:hypothetical protein GXW83_16640 [Streptacidiphilus sp. PB12-B1b]|nr:hypothetical protein GXW83_16640 [Streptacidiphilus sp. PB12-B1b]
MAADAERGHPDVVTVMRTQVKGPGGHPVYADATGIVRAEISDRGEVRMLATSTHQDVRRPVGCRALPPKTAA